MSPYIPSLLLGHSNSFDPFYELAWHVNSLQKEFRVKVNLNITDLN